jgi:multiple sugar transport system substrate-binding protein
MIYQHHVIKRFEAKNPNINVEYVGIPNSLAKSKYDAAIAANDMPDVGSVQTTWLPEFSLRGALLPLDSYFNKSDLKGKINKGAVDFNKGITRDKKLYGIPYTQNLDIIWLRSDWFQQAGVKVPATWDDFFNSANQMTDKTKNHYGFTTRGPSWHGCLYLSEHGSI